MAGIKEEVHDEIEIDDSLYEAVKRECISDQEDLIIKNEQEHLKPAQKMTRIKEVHDFTDEIEIDDSLYGAVKRECISDQEDMLIKTEQENLKVARIKEEVYDFIDEIEIDDSSCGAVKRECISDQKDIHIRTEQMASIHAIEEIYIKTDVVDSDTDSTMDESPFSVEDLEHFQVKLEYEDEGMLPECSFSSDTEEIEGSNSDVQDDTSSNSVLNEQQTNTIQYGIKIVNVFTNNNDVFQVDRYSEYEPLADSFTNSSEVIDHDHVPTGTVKASKSPLGATAMNLSSARNKRVYDKRDSCLFCGKLCSKLCKHLEKIHPNEREVVMFLSFEKKSEERRILIKNLRNRGNYIFNKEAHNNGKQIIPVRRPDKNCGDSKYLPCVHCLAFFKRTSISRHVHTCFRNSIRVRNGSTISKSLTLLTAPENTSKFMRELLNKMLTDKYSLIIRNDDLIMKYGEWLCEKYSRQWRTKNDISQRLRELARLMNELARKKIPNLRTALKAINFFLVVQSVKHLSGLDRDSGRRRATLAIKIGNSIQKCLQLLKNEAILERKDEMRKETDDFIELYRTNWHVQVLHKATEELEKAKRKKRSLNPVAEDERKSKQKMGKMASPQLNETKCEDESATASPGSINRSNRHKKRPRQIWVDDEISAVTSFFAKHILRKKVPSKRECVKCIEKHPVLKLRSWVTVKSKVHNLFRDRKITEIH